MFKAMKIVFGAVIGYVLALAFLAVVALSLMGTAHAGMTLFLEGEDDLGNGFKLCHYTQGYTITIASHRLCPLSVTP